MIERILYDTIQAGAAYFAADTHRLDAIFQPEGSTVRISNAEMQKIRTDWTDYTANLHYLRLGYATEPTMVPCYAIVLNDDEIKQEFLNNTASTDYDTTVHPNQVKPSIGIIEERTYSVIVYGIGVEQCLYHYKILKNIFLMQFLRLQQDPNWMIAPKVRGRELEPLNMGLPKLVYLRAISFTGGVEEYYDQILTDVPFLVRAVDIHRDNDDGLGGIKGVEVLTP